MRIAMIGPFGLRPKGTMQARALPLARALAHQGHELYVVMPPWHTPDEPPRAWRDGAVTLEYVSLRPDIPLLGPLIVTLRLIGRALAWRPDVIHCFKPKGYAGLASWFVWHMRRLRLTSARLVVDEDDWEGAGGWNEVEPYPALLRLFFAWQERWGLRHCDAVSVASRTLESLVWSLGVRPSRVCYLPMGVGATPPGDGQAIRRRHDLGDGPLILVYTRFFEYDVARLVRVLSRVVAELPEVRILVVGSGLFGSDDQRFDRLSEAEALEAYVVRAGWVAFEDLPGHFAAADVAVHLMDDTLLNRCKGVAKLVELLAAGVPVVADAVGQHAEYIVPGETGMLTSVGQDERMAREIVALLRNGELRASIGRAAAAHMQAHYAWPLLASRLEQHYAAARPSSSRA